MRFIGRTIKYLLRSVFSIIIFLLLVGLAKTNRDVYTYIDSLNATDWSVFHRSQPATWTDPFWTNKQISGDIAGILSTSGDNLSTDSSGLDAYDPALEQDLNTITDTSLSGDEKDYGFVTSGQITSTTGVSSGTTSKAALLNVIKQRELKK